MQWHVPQGVMVDCQIWKTDRVVWTFSLRLLWLVLGNGTSVCVRAITEDGSDLWIAFSAVGSLLLLLFKSSNWIWCRGTRWNNERPLLSAVLAYSALGTFLCKVEDTLAIFVSCFFPRTPAINANKTALCSLAWECNLTFISSENASVDSGRHQRTCYPGNLGDRPWEPLYHNKYQACVLKAIKSLRYAAYVCTHLSEAYASLPTLLAVAVEMKYWPPESHLAPNWAILLLFSPFRLWLSLLQSDGWKQV